METALASRNGSINAEAIPSELTGRRQWVVWRTGAKDKVPLSVSGRRASSIDPSTWSTFETVTKHAIDGSGLGIGFVLSADDPYCGIDLDGCRDPQSGDIRPWAQRWIGAFASYTEVSPSGTGVKLICRGTNTRGKGGNHKVDEPNLYGKVPGVEIYDNARFWTFTGWHQPGTPNTVEGSQDAINEILGEYWRPAKTTAAGNAGPTREDLVDRCWKYVQKMDDAISGNGGHNATFAAACKCFMFGLTDGESLEVMRRFNATKTGAEPWSERDLDHKINDARQQVTAGGTFGEMTRNDIKPARAESSNGTPKANIPATLPESNGLVTNGIEKSMVDTKTEKTKTVVVPLSMEELIRNTERQTGNWPRRVDDVLFVHDDQHGICHLDKPQSLFGWLHRRVGKVTWHNGKSVVKQPEFFAELQRTATTYQNVEAFPHEPPLEDHYYACNTPEAGDGSKLRELVQRFAPATLVDHDLILSAFVTPGWGGTPGTRPCYVITSSFGRGVGKSTLAEMVGQLWGGVLSFSHHEDVQKIKTRLLTPNAMSKRVCLLDNVKSLKFSWAELEHMITATSIDGHRMYHGNGTRPNSLTWCVTLNGASLSTDLAQRSVIIELDKPKRAANWLDDTRQFIEKNRPELIGDVLGILRTPPKTLERFTRWATWEREVLARMPEPSDCQKVISERQDAVDVEGEEATTIEDDFAGRLRGLGYDPDSEWIFITSGIANKWYCLGQNDRVTTTQSTRILKQMGTEGRLKRLQFSKRSDIGRGFLWAGESTASHIALDLLSRVAAQANGGF